MIPQDYPSADYRIIPILQIRYLMCLTLGNVPRVTQVSLSTYDLFASWTVFSGTDPRETTHHSRQCMVCP